MELKDARENTKNLYFNLFRSIIVSVNSKSATKLVTRVIDSLSEEQKAGVSSHMTSELH